MAKLYISEYSDIAHQPYGAEAISAMQEPSIIEQTPVVIGGGSLKSAAFNGATRVVRLHTDAICSIAFGLDPTATANTKRMAANSTEYFGVEPGHKVAVITNT